MNRPETNGLTKFAHHACACKCGFGVNSAKATYLPGHDARHVSNLLAQAAKDGFNETTVYPLAQQLPSAALARKFELAVERAKTRGTTPRKPATPQQEWYDCTTDEYRKGRWTYPLQVKMWADDRNSDYLDFRRNTKRDGSGEWVEIDDYDNVHGK